MHSKDLINLPVETESGISLGYLKGFEIMDHQIIKYYVKTKKFSYLAKNLIISKNQVISLNQEKMVVEENVKKDFEKETIPLRERASEGASLVSTRS